MGRHPTRGTEGSSGDGEKAWSKGRGIFWGLGLHPLPRGWRKVSTSSQSGLKVLAPRWDCGRVTSGLPIHPEPQNGTESGLETRLGPVRANRDSNRPLPTDSSSVRNSSTRTAMPPVGRLWLRDELGCRRRRQRRRVGVNRRSRRSPDRRK
jgi:hypothetical protein